MDSLPIAEFKIEICNSVKNNPVTIINAETGAGKSTKVPQYLMEMGYDVIVTQPRRLAARSLSERVAQELGCEFGKEVGFQTAHERICSADTRCLFVTDGLQLVHQLVQKKSVGNRVLVIDEVHEWNLNIEVLIAWTRRQIQQGAEFKLVVMSATIDTEGLSEFFNKAPVISVPGRLFPITTIPPTSSLVEDVISLANQGRNVLVFQPGKQEISKTIDEIINRAGTRFKILPLHGELTSEEQNMVFKHYSQPKIIVSTNVAQTSITIDDIDAVVDSGAERRVELINGVDGLYIRPISLADSKQRAGRAGRTKEGIYIDWCESAERNQFPKSEIERVRLDQTVLRLAEVGFDMENLKFFHQPDISKIKTAKSDLKKLGCMDDNGRVTPIGKKVAKLPISVSSGRMVIEAERLGVMYDVITIAAILESGQLNARKDPLGNENVIWRNHVGKTYDSDLIAQRNLYESASRMNKSEMFEAGIHIGAFYRAKEVRNNIEKALKKLVNNTETSGTVGDTLKAVCAGMVNNFYARSFGTGYRGSDGVNRSLNRDSVVVSMKSEYLVGIPMDLEINDRRGKTTLNLITMASKIDVSMIEEVAPQLITRQKTERARFSDELGTVVSVVEVMFNNVVIREEEVEDPEHPDAIQLMVDRLYSDFMEKHDHNETLSFISQLTELHTDVKSFKVGSHPKTGEDLMIYFTYKRSRFGNYVIPTWTRNQAEANAESRNLKQFMGFRTAVSDIKAKPATEQLKKTVEVLPSPKLTGTSLQKAMLSLKDKFNSR